MAGGFMAQAQAPLSKEQMFSMKEMEKSNLPRVEGISSGCAYSTTGVES